MRRRSVLPACCGGRHAPATRGVARRGKTRNAFSRILLEGEGHGRAASRGARAATIGGEGNQQGFHFLTADGRSAGAEAQPRGAARADHGPAVPREGWQRGRRQRRTVRWRQNAQRGWRGRAVPVPDRGAPEALLDRRDRLGRPRAVLRRDAKPTGAPLDFRVPEESADSLPDRLHPVPPIRRAVSPALCPAGSLPGRLCARPALCPAASLPGRHALFRVPNGPHEGVVARILAAPVGDGLECACGDLGSITPAIRGGASQAPRRVSCCASWSRRPARDTLDASART